MTSGPPAAGELYGCVLLYRTVVGAKKSRQHFLGVAQSPKSLLAGYSLVSCGWPLRRRPVTEVVNPQDSLIVPRSVGVAREFLDFFHFHGTFFRDPHTPLA